MAQLVGILSRQSLTPTFDKLAECLNLRERTLVDIERKQHGVRDDAPQADAVVVGGAHNLVYRRVANAACGIVHNTLESLLVIGVGHHTEVGYDIFDFLALVER